MKLNRTPNPLDRNARNGENVNWDKIEGAVKDVKNVVDDFIGTVSDEVINELIDNAQLNWKEFVDSYEDLPTDAQNGDTVLTRDDGKVYRFDGSEWVVIQQIDINAINEIEQRLDDKFTQKYEDVKTQLAETEQELQEKAEKEDVERIKNKLKGVKFSDLSEPMVFAHRGAKNIFPESSLEAYRACVDLGLPIEVDVRMTSDGILVVNHDTTVNRTTNRTGSVNNYSVAGFKSLTITELGTDFTGTTVTLQDLFIEFGNKAIYIIESKEWETAQPIVDMIQEYNLEENVLFQSFDRDDLLPALRAGIPTMFLTERENPNTIKNDGIEWVGVSKGVYESYILDCLSEGLKVGVYTVNRRFEYDKFVNLGVHAVFSDDPIWINRRSKTLNRDNYDQQTYYHGQTSPEYRENNSKVAGTRGFFTPPGRFGWDRLEISTEEVDRDFVMQGWSGELPTNFKLTLDIFPQDVKASREYASVTICTPNDYFDDYSYVSSGYNIVFRKNGSTDIYEVINGDFELIENKLTGVEMSTGERLSVVITVNGDNIKVEREDSDYTGVIFNINNTKYRNGYLHIGRRQMGVFFGNMRLVKL